MPPIYAQSQSLNALDASLTKETRPTNTYYIMPNYHRILAAYLFIGTLTCVHLTPRLSPPSTAFLWLTYLVFAVALVLMSTYLCISRQMVDEDGRGVVVVKCPVIGLRWCEVELDFEGVRKGVYRCDARMGDGGNDERLNDGWRYGRALVRV